MLAKEFQEFVFWLLGLLSSLAPGHALAVAPTITGWSNVATFTEDNPAVVIDSTITISDSDSTNMNRAIITIVAPTFISSEDILLYTTMNGITGSFSGGAMTLTGSATKAQYQQAVGSV